MKPVLTGLGKYRVECLIVLRFRGDSRQMEVAEDLPELTAEPSCAGGASSGSADIEEPLTPGRTERSTGTSAQQVRVLAVIPLCLRICH